jgi:glycosyltransferase involved in cell wall biosynthesis
MKKGVIHLIDSEGFYGAEAVVLNLCIGFKESGFKAMIGCFRNVGREKPHLGLIYIFSKNKLDLKVLKQIYGIINQENIAFIHSHGYKPSFYCLLSYLFYHVPYIITCHLWTRETYRMGLYNLVDKISMIFAKKVIAVSRPIAKDICSWRVLRKKVKVINNGINIDKYSDYRNSFNPKKLREELGLKENTRLVGTLGRLTFQKAHHYLIEAAKITLKHQKDIEFLIGGEGHRMEFLKDLTIKYGIADRFHFIGFRSDAINVLKLLDVFVLCSIDEGLPIVLLEAMSAGIPVITTDVGEIPMVIQDNLNGIIIKKGDVKLLADSITRLLNDDALCKGLAKRGRETVESEFSIGKMTAGYLEIYGEV